MAQTENTGVETRQAARVFDDEGRFAPELIEGTEEILPCDTVLLAIGQMADTGFASGVQELDLGGGGTVVADFDTGRTSVPWIFAGGDIALGPRLFIDGVAQGQRAAKAIHEFVTDETIEESKDRAFACEFVRQGLQHDYLESARLFPPATEPASRLEATDAPVEVMYDDLDARAQGNRCLRCEVETVFDGTQCILCGGCADVCPTFCLRLVSLEEIGMADPSMPGASAIIKDEDRCIRCAQCAIRCPTDAITMERLVGHEPWQVVRT